MADSGAKASGTIGRLLYRLRALPRERRERAAIAASGLFDPAWYLAANPDVAATGADPLTHYVRAGAGEGRRPSPWFDLEWYLARNPDVASSRQSPLAHYVRFGAAEGRDPNPVFSGRWYLRNNPEAAAAPTPLTHYLRSGAAAFRDPSPDLDTAWYVERNPDVAASGLDPLAHYLLVGRAEGRSASPYAGAAEAGRPVTSARLEAFKALEPVGGETVALFAAHAPDGVLKPNVAPYVEALVGCGVKVVLVVAADRPLAIDPALKACLAGGYVRDNAGFDFAAWAHLMRAEPGLFAAEALLLVNDSLIGPSSPAALQVLLERARAHPAEVVGAVDSYEIGWHLQSFFIHLKQRALADRATMAFFGSVRSLDDKRQVIRAYEMRLAAAMQAAGFETAALFPSEGRDNPTFARWRELIAAGFPFVKTLTLKGAREDADIEGWRETLGEAGFDLAVAEATLAQPPASPPPPRGWPLLRHADDAAATAPPWKLAFIGPWNYASGLGEASRGYLSALWRTGARLNLRPVPQPFHIHHRLAPPFAIDDFEGQADVAIAHMNPDSWPLLGEDDYAVMARARRSVGLWVWEMGQVPAPWRAALADLDAVWAPSRYCAGIFAAAGARRTAVVPHVVPLPPPGEPVDRAATLARFGLGPEARVILYTFDGASFLVRKNPHALVRAFAASGLAAAGWRLVLKTKNLMDSPEEGRGLAALVAGDPAVVLIDRSLPREALSALFAAADIYASPHRSEGFGLTIAEAMAMGKAVVASDYGGSRDFLDETCGYPVPARDVVLDRDHGPYLKGNVWGEVDEKAFAAALREAAARIDEGDRSMGERARARIAERLSAEAVAEALRAALAEVIAPPAREQAA